MVIVNSPYKDKFKENTKIMTVWKNLNKIIPHLKKNKSAVKAKSQKQRTLDLIISKKGYSDLDINAGYKYQANL